MLDSPDGVESPLVVSSRVVVKIKSIINTAMSSRDNRSAKYRQSGAAVMAVFSGLFIASVAVVVLFSVFGKVVPPNYIGVRQNFFALPFLEKGFGKEGLEPGLQWTIPYVSEVRLLPRAFQYVHFNDQAQNSDLDLASLDIPTRDGSKVKTDVTLIVRLFDQSSSLEEPAAAKASESADLVPMVDVRKRAHGGPRELIELFKLEPKEQLRVFAQTSEDVLRQSLGKLSTIDYYNPVKRETAALGAYEAINTSVNPKGVELWAALIRRYTYVERSIDDQIFQKNLQDQTERMNAALSRLAAAQAETERAQALWDAKIRDLQVEAESQVRVIRSKGSLYETTKVSEGDRMVAEARAKIDEEKANALSQLQGAQLYTAREMAPLLRTLQGGVVSNLDPYDISAWMKKLVKPESATTVTRPLPRQTPSSAYGSGSGATGGAASGIVSPSGDNANPGGQP